MNVLHVEGSRKFNFQAFYTGLAARGQLPEGITTDGLGNVTENRRQAKKIAKRQFGLTGRQYRLFERALRAAQRGEPNERSAAATVLAHRIAAAIKPATYASSTKFNRMRP